jgi:hypothetical protein
MKKSIQSLSVALLVLCSFSTARSERPSESQQDATHVVEGVVEGVYESAGARYTSWVVKVRVAKVVRGKGAEAGKVFYAECFRRNPHEGPGEPEPGASGHAGVPEVGDSVRVFTNERRGVNEGVYPDWFDVLTKESGE